MLGKVFTYLCTSVSHRKALVNKSKLRNAQVRAACGGETPDQTLLGGEWHEMRSEVLIFVLQFLSHRSVLRDKSKLLPESSIILKILIIELLK